MMKPIVLVDVDNVVAFFTPHFVEVAQKLLDRAFELEQALSCFEISEALSLSPDEDEAVHEALCEPGVAGGLNPLGGAIQGIKTLMDISYVYFVTKPLKKSKTWVYEREHWLINHFGEENTKVIHTPHKYLVYGDYLIEDSAENAVAWQTFQHGHGNPNARALLIDHPYNREEQSIARFESWEHIVNEITNRQ